MIYYHKDNLPKVCKECGEEFSALKSLHAHFKKHKIFMGDYYVKHFPRKSVHTGNLLPFKTLDQYMSSFFANKKEEKDWLLSAPPERVKKYCKKAYKDLINTKNKKFAPYYNEAETRDLPSVDLVRKAFWQLW